MMTFWVMAPAQGMRMNKIAHVKADSPQEAIKKAFDVDVKPCELGCVSGPYVAQSVECNGFYYLEPINA